MLYNDKKINVFTDISIVKIKPFVCFQKIIEVFLFSFFFSFFFRGLMRFGQFVCMITTHIEKPPFRVIDGVHMP